MYKDLSKVSSTSEDWLVRGDNVIEEVFDTIAHTEKGDVFYARDLGSDLEKLLFSLDENELSLRVTGVLSNFKYIDGRLGLDLNNTSVTRDRNDIRTLNISTQTSKGIALNTKVGQYYGE